MKNNEHRILIAGNWPMLNILAQKLRSPYGDIVLGVARNPYKMHWVQEKDWVILELVSEDTFAPCLEVLRKITENIKNIWIYSAWNEPGIGLEFSVCHRSMLKIDELNDELMNIVESHKEVKSQIIKDNQRIMMALDEMKINQSEKAMKLAQDFLKDNEDYPSKNEKEAIMQWAVMNNEVRVIENGLKIKWALPHTELINFFPKKLPWIGVNDAKEWMSYVLSDKTSMGSEIRNSEKSNLIHDFLSKINGYESPQELKEALKILMQEDYFMPSAWHVPFMKSSNQCFNVIMDVLREDKDKEDKFKAIVPLQNLNTYHSSVHPRITQGLIELTSRQWIEIASQTIHDQKFKSNLENWVLNQILQNNEDERGDNGKTKRL